MRLLCTLSQEIDVILYKLYMLGLNKLKDNRKSYKKVKLNLSRNVSWPKTNELLCILSYANS